MSTAQSPSGSPVVGRAVHATDTIEYQGQRFSVAIAQSLGLLNQQSTMDETGRVASTFVATDTGNDGMTQPNQDAAGIELADGTVLQPDDKGLTVNSETGDALAELQEAVSSDTLITAMNSYMRDGDFDANVVGRLAEQSGREPEDVAASLAQIEADTGKALMNHLGKLGVHNEDAFQSFIQSSEANIGEAREALHNLMMYGTTGGWDTLAEQYTEQLAKHAPQDVTDALDDVGWAWRWSLEGNLLVDTPSHGEVTFEQGVKAGAIKFLK